jgi:hypothetical protein
MTPISAYRNVVKNKLYHALHKNRRRPNKIFVYLHKNNIQYCRVWYAVQFILAQHAASTLAKY